MFENFNRYEHLKDKYKNMERFVDFRKQAINKLTSVYQWEGIDDYIPPTLTGQWLEYLLLKFGCAAIGKVEGELTICRGMVGGEPDRRFGTPTQFTWYTNGGLSGVWEIGKDCVVFLANPSMYPDIFTVDRYCHMLAETDLSIECMLIYSRDIPIPLVMTDNEKKEVENAIQAVRSGKMAVVQSFNIAELNKLDITNPEMIQYMTNYNTLHDELMKRLFLEFGIAIDNKDKKAQLTTEELDAYSQLAGASFYSRYRLRERAAAAANELFGINISVKPFEYFDDLSNGRNEDFVEDTAETVEETATTEETAETVETEEQADEMENDPEEHNAAE